MRHPSKMPAVISAWLHSPLLEREHLENSAKKTLPVATFALSGVLTLLLALSAGLFGGRGPSPRLGSILFHVYFSIVFYVMAWVGTGTAARSFARERAAGTWDALRLTTMTPEQIAKGKLASAFVQTISALLILAPPGIIPWVVGGVSATELILGYLGLWGFAMLWVVLGATVGAKVAAPTFAMALAILVGAALAGILHWGGGLLLSVLLHQSFPVVTRGAPIWWPVAVAGSPFSLAWATWLLILPLAFSLGIGSLLYQLIVNAIRHPLDEQTLGIRRWFITTTVLFGPLATLAVKALDHRGHMPAVALLGLLFALSFAWAVWLAADPTVASTPAGLLHRGVREPDGTRDAGGVPEDHHREERLAPFYQRPGLLPSMGTSLVVTVASFAITTGMLAAVTTSRASVPAGMDALRVGLVGLWMTPFAGICIAAAGLLRLRCASPQLARILTIAVGIALWVLPGLFTNVGSSLGLSHNGQLVLRASFPSYGLALTEALPSVPPVLIGGAVVGMLVALVALSALLVAFARHKATRELPPPE